MPEPMIGTILYPLNTLENRDRETWLRQRAKYDGRERVLGQRVPLLECLWNDVLHLSPVHPREIVEALEAAGFAAGRRRFFAIDAALLDREHTVVFLNSTDREHRFDEEQWTWFDPGLVARLARLPQLTRGYYTDCARDGTQPLLFAYVPHVLLRGSLDATDLPVVEV